MNFLAPAAFASPRYPGSGRFLLPQSKRVVKLVSSTLLWQRFLSETQAVPPFKSCGKLAAHFANHLLILAVLALARLLCCQDKPAQLRVVILDASASMQAR